MANANRALVAEVDGVCGGCATIVGTRIQVGDVLLRLSWGLSAEEISRDFRVEVRQVLACVVWASRLIDRHYGDGAAHTDGIVKVADVHSPLLP